MAKKKYYAVKNGRKPGIYEEWYGPTGAWAQVDGYKGASYKGFSSKEEAQAYLNADTAKAKSVSKQIANCTIDDQNKEFDAGKMALSEPYAFTDGSYNTATGVYGYGGFLVMDGIRYELFGSGDEPEAAKSRNVSGEVMGAMAAVDKAKELGLKTLTLYYDYEGIAKWARGEWKTNKELTKEYAAYMQQSDITVQFVHVKAHTGIPGNEEADRLAKKAVGI